MTNKTEPTSPNKPTRPRKPRTDADKIAEAVAMVRKLGADAYMAGDEEKAKRCKNAAFVLLAIEEP